MLATRCLSSLIVSSQAITRWGMFVNAWFINSCSQRRRVKKIKFSLTWQINSIAITMLVSIWQTSKLNLSINSSKTWSVIMKNLSLALSPKTYLIKSTMMRAWKIHWKFTLPSPNSKMISDFHSFIKKLTKAANLELMIQTIKILLKVKA